MRTDYTHHSSRPATRQLGDREVTLPRRVLDKIEVTDGHWLWRGTIRRPDGYGSVWTGARHTFAHRWIYELLVAPVPSDLELDHLCRVRECVNPDHLEPVPHLVNVLRGVSPAALAVRTNFCKYGHEYTPENTRRRKDGTRACRECNRAATRRRRVPPRPPLTHCPQGHQYDEANTYIRQDGRRECRRCRNSSSTAAQRKQRTAA